MAKKKSPVSEGKAGLLRALAFQVHRKRALNEVLAEHIEQQLQLGRHREFRAINDALAEDGVIAALKALDLLGAEAAVVLAVVVEAKDHRLLSNALSGLAEFWDANPED
ncbi:MAG TPA: hypothetical protein VK558_01405 [Patescibacteria group bacterium]|nr:hypothetical protein [Patescibacteria group bacterium]